MDMPIPAAGRRLASVLAGVVLAILIVQQGAARQAARRRRG